MKENYKRIRSSIIWLVFIISTIFFKAIGVENIPTLPFVIYFIILGILICSSLYKHRNEILGVNYNMTLAVSIVFAVISSLFTIILPRYYPRVFEKYFTLLGGVSVISFLLMMGVLIFGGFLKNKQNKK